MPEGEVTIKAPEVLPPPSQPQVQTMIVPVLGESKAEVLQYIKMLFIGGAGIMIFLFSEVIFLILDRLKGKWANPTPPAEEQASDGNTGESWR